jgi:hypothetical protein
VVLTTVLWYLQPPGAIAVTLQQWHRHCYLQHMLILCNPDRPADTHRTATSLQVPSCAGRNHLFSSRHMVGTPQVSHINVQYNLWTRFLPLSCHVSIMLDKITTLNFTAQNTT